MSILWCGAEDIDFVTWVLLSMSTTGASYRSSNGVRASILSSGGIGTGYGKSVTFPDGTVTSCWLSFRVYPSSPSAGSLFVGLGASGTVKSGLFVGNAAASATRCALVKYDGTTKTELASEAGNSFPNITLVKVDVQITNFGANATVKVYVNGILVITYNGDVTVTGVASLDCLMIGGANNMSASELIVADEDTRTFGLTTMAPSAAGDANAWTGLFSAINEITIDDSSVVYTNGNGNDVQYNLLDFPAGTFGVKAILVSARAGKSSGSTPGTLKLGIKTGGTINVDAGNTVTTAWQTFQRLMQTNPVTGLAWVQGDMNALQIDLQSAA